MGVAGGFEILGAFAGRFSCMELSEIEEACAKIGIQIQGKELIDKISDLKNSGHLKVYGYGKSIEVIATQKGREAYRDYRSFILGRMSDFLPEISDRGKPAMGEVGCGVGYVLTASDWRLINAVRKLPARTRGIIRRLVEDAARMVEEGVGHDRV
jgi:hypothetical protein